MYCTQCGTQIGDAARFCNSCGKPTSPGAVPGEAPPPLNDFYGTTSYGAAEPRKLHRILRDKKIAGVCAGYAEYFSMDLTLMRLIWVGLLLVPPNIGLIAYIVSWVVLPKDALPKDALPNHD